MAARAARTSAWAAWVQVGVAVVVAFGAGGGTGFVVGRKGTNTRTTTHTRVDTVTTTVSSGATAPPPGTVACAPRPGPPGPANSAPGQAAGPLVANQPVAGAIHATNETHYLALCLSRGAELTFSLDCIRGSCSAPFGSFPADSGSSFQPGQALTCNIKAPGRYTVSVQANDVPVTYQLLVQTRDAGALVDSLQANLPPPDPSRAC